MKMLLAIAFAAAVATPAVAQTEIMTPDGLRAYNYVPPQRLVVRRPFAVFDARGRYIGSDPDPTIRQQLRRDPPNGSGD